MPEGGSILVHVKLVYNAQPLAADLPRGGAPNVRRLRGAFVRLSSFSHTLTRDSPMAPRHKHKAIAERHDDFLSESDLSSDDSQLSPAEGRYRENTRSASAVALPPSRQGSYKDEDESSASDVDEKKVGRHSALPGRGDSFDLGSSDGDSDEEQLVGTGKKSRKAAKSVASKKKKQQRSWLMRSVAADGTTTQPVIPLSLRTLSLRPFVIAPCERSG